EALPASRGLWGDMHPNHLELGQALADLRERQGDEVEARRLYQQVLDNRRRTLGAEHADTLLVLRRLATLHDRVGDPRLGGPTDREVLACWRTSGRQPPAWVAELLYELAALCVRLGRPGEALPLMREAQAIDDRHIEQVFSFGSEPERLACVAA